MKSSGAGGAAPGCEVGPVVWASHSERASKFKFTNLSYVHDARHAADAVEADGDLALLGRVRVRGDVEASGVEARQVLITSVTDRSQNLEIVNGLEEIRLAVAVVADDDGTVGWELEINAVEIPKIANRESVEPDAVVAHLSVTFP